MKAIKLFGMATAMVVAMSAPGYAGVTVIGPGIGGDVNVANGASLWSVVDGVQTSTPVGDNSKNAILRYYVVATGAGGAESVFSLGEIDPAFGGTGAAPYIAVSGSTYSLIDPATGAAARGLSDLESLHVLAVAASRGNGGASTSVKLSGLVTNPGGYTKAQLQNNFTPVTETVSGDAYTGVPLWKFLKPTSLSNVTSQIVTTVGTDGYTVALSLAELDPSLGGNPSNLLAYADTGGNFPGSGVARTIFPTDNKHGRWMSNLDSVGVTAVPEPSTWAMLLIGFAGLGFAGYRQAKDRQSGALAG